MNIICCAASELMLFTWDAFECQPFDIAMKLDGLITPAKLLKPTALETRNKKQISELACRGHRICYYLDCLTPAMDSETECQWQS